MKLDEWTQQRLSPESPVIRLVGKYADLMGLNLLWLLCSLPVVTIGASTTALLQAVTAVREDAGKPTRIFFAAFRGKFRKATAVWLLALAVGCVMVYNLLFSLRIQAEWKLFLTGAWILLAFFYLACVSYVFPVLAKYDLKIGKAMKGAFFASLSRLEITLAVIGLNAVPLVLALGFPYYFLHTLLIWLLFGFSLIAYIDAWLIQKVFSQIDPPKDPVKR